MNDPIAALPEGLNIVEIDLIEATPTSLDRYGLFVDNPHGHEIEICVWPQPGWRTIDPDTGNEGGTTEGTFHFWWDKGIYHGANAAVNDSYVLGWSYPPNDPSVERPVQRAAAYLWHANYHPDGDVSVDQVRLR